MEHGAVVREMKQRIADLWEDLRAKRVIASNGEVPHAVQLVAAQSQWAEEVPTLCAAIKALTVEVPERCIPRA